MAHIRARVVVPLLLIVAFIAGCAKDAASEADPDPRVLDQFLTWGDPDDAVRLEREYHDQVEQVIAECMESAGLQYVPVALEAVAFGTGMGISRSEYARAFGFGISTVDDEREAAIASTTDAGDPNLEYEASLSSDRAFAYANQRAACDEKAWSAAPHVTEAFIQAVYDLEDRVRADAVVVEAESEWAGCVRDGDDSIPSFGTLPDLLAWLQTEYERVREQPDQLARLQDLERRLAVRHLECEPALVATMREVAAQFESDVIEEYSTVIAEQSDFLGG